MFERGGGVGAGKALSRRRAHPERMAVSKRRMTFWSRCWCRSKGPEDTNTCACACEW